jgi:hypothetical protein
MGTVRRLIRMRLMIRFFFQKSKPSVRHWLKHNNKLTFFCIDKSMNKSVHSIAFVAWDLSGYCLSYKFATSRLSSDLINNPIIDAIRSLLLFDVGFIGWYVYKCNWLKTDQLEMYHCSSQKRAGYCAHKESHRIRKLLWVPRKMRVGYLNTFGTFWYN